MKCLSFNHKIMTIIKTERPARLRRDLENFDYGLYMADNAKKCQGFRLALNPGINTVPVIISGYAKMMLGFCFGGLINNYIDSFSFELNNETIITDANYTMYSIDLGLNAFEYFPYPRKLTGKDNIKFTFNMQFPNLNAFGQLYYV